MGKRIEEASQDKPHGIHLDMRSNNKKPKFSLTESIKEEQRKSQFSYSPHFTKKNDSVSTKNKHEQLNSHSLPHEHQRYSNQATMNVLKDHLMPGDIITIKTAAIDETGIFVEINNHYLIWTDLTYYSINYTDLFGISIKKLSQAAINNLGL